MNEMLSSSPWPNFPTSRPNLPDQFTFGPMSVWQQNTPTAELFSPDDYINMWSAPTDTIEENEKESFIKSIWSTNASPSIYSSTDINSVTSEVATRLDETPTNSPSLKRAEIINCNERWGIVKINQITPWNIVEIDESEKCLHDPMVWRAKVDGTEVWEEYYVKQHGRRRPQTESTFGNENVWSSASDISQSSNSMWPPKSNDVSSPSSDVYSQNMFGEINSRSNFSTPNGVRPSMTRNQAQKYLIDMGYSLSDAIGALVNNQMDLPNAIKELQSKYRMPANGPTIPNGMYTPTLSFNNRTGDSVNMTRLPPGTPLNHLLGHNTSNVAPNIGSNFCNNFDMYLPDSSDQVPESQYSSMDPGMSQYGAVRDTKRQNSMPTNRDNIFRSTFASNAMNSRTLSNNSDQFPDMGAMNQGMSRMNMGYNNGMVCQNGSYGNKWPANPNGMHNSNNSATNMMLNANGSVDMRQNFAPAMSSAFGRSISKQQLYQHNPSSIGWHSDASSISPNGALNDISQVRLAKNLPYLGLADNTVGIVIRKVPSQHIERIQSICFDSGAMTNFQLQPQTQSILVFFSCQQKARCCMALIQSQLGVRVDLVGEDYMNRLMGAN